VNLQLLQDGVIDGPRLITHHYDLADAPASFELLDSANHARSSVHSSRRYAKLLVACRWATRARASKEQTDDVLSELIDADAARTGQT